MSSKAFKIPKLKHTAFVKGFIVSDVSFELYSINTAASTIVCIYLIGQQSAEVIDYIPCRLRAGDALFGLQISS